MTAIPAAAIRMPGLETQLLKGAKILGVAAQRPAKTLANAELDPALNTSDEWIRTRTGIESRGVADDSESVIEMSTAAAAKALAAAGVDAADVDLLLVATATMPTPTPGASPQIAYNLGIPGGALDVNGACAGFCYSLALAADAIRSGSARYAVVIGAEKLTDWIDWTNRDVCVLFGDGAGAAVLGPCDSSDNGIGPVAWGSDGSKADYIAVPDWGRYLGMNGQAVFRWATEQVSLVSRQACELAGVAPEELAAFIPHQANLRIIDAAARQLGLSEACVIAEDVRTSGNTSAASIPLAMASLAEQARVPSGAPVLLVSFGAGMSWAAQVVRFP